MNDTTFHAGEIVMQQRAGVREHMAGIGDRVIRDHMPDQHRELFRKLPTLVVGSVDAQRRPWASMLVGRPGFVHDLDAYRLRVDAQPFDGDRLAEHLALGASLGLLGLEPQTRRRNRMNGRVTSLDERGFVVMVEQSFGNCPQYIQARTPTWVADDAARTPQRVVQGGADLGDELVSIVRMADTFFIASAAPAGSGRSAGADVSHRGGRPGFVRVDASTQGSVLTVPDFRGNFFFNTLGNIVANPQAGLLFVDYERGDVLQIGGRAVVIEGGHEVRQFEGAQRLIRIVVERSVLLRGAMPLRWSAAQPAVQLAATGVWPQVAAAVD
jgi:predicted pyridoxine 5'-phosphate oxidase superfamily flavin-nucleotide-binding protein